MYGPCNKCEYCRDAKGRTFLQVSEEYLKLKKDAEEKSKKEEAKNGALLRSVFIDFNEEAILNCKKMLQEYNSKYIFTFEKTGYERFDQMVEYIKVNNLVAAGKVYDEFLKHDVPRIFEHARWSSEQHKPEMFCRQQIRIASEEMFPKLDTEKVENGSLGCGQFKAHNQEVLME